ncbi:hypothetical protein [Arsenophonus sp. PmNCSU2021_1]|uniref:hypothetical protein n=1 Tax=Arsenophonus sp. PmNCSU2021_1 TaxID=3118989 RepID=UPI002FEEDC88
MSEFEAMLAEDMGRFFYDPLSFVMYAFAWGEGELKGFDGPDKWQKDFLLMRRAIFEAKTCDKW